MNVRLLSAYFEATEGETNTRKYAARLAELWAEQYPEKLFIGKHLIAQVKNIKTRKLLAPDEVEAMKTNAIRSSTGRTIQNIRRSIQRRSTIAQRPETAEEQYEEEQQMMETERDEHTTGIRTIYEQVNLKWEGVRMDARPKITKVPQNKNTKEIIQAINNTLKPAFNNTKNLEELCHTIYCAATVANIILETKAENRTREELKELRPPWEQRIERKITNLRKEIGILHTYVHTTAPSKKVEKKIEKYIFMLKIKSKTKTEQREQLKIYTETLKHKIAALGNRLRRYHKRTQRYKDNNLFSNNQRQFFRKLEEGKGEKTTNPPHPEDMRQYWTKIWTNRGEHRTTAAWIEREKREHDNVRDMPEINITEEDVKETIRRTKNWTAPGIDNIHNYWWKSFTHTHQALARLIRKALEDPQTIPEYFTQGTTLMLPKKGDLTQAKNYRPRTCLPSAYKKLTSTIGHKIQIHLKQNNIMAWEQNGCREKGRGSKELLLIDKMLTRQAKRRLKNISMAWIDYQKAYDSVPHSWLVEILEIYKVNRLAINLIKSLMSTWRTTLSIKTRTTTYRTEEIQIRNGIFQGDGLSPLLFCLALNPLSNMLNSSAYGYTINEQTKITHLFYMDDLKLFARGKKQLEGELELVRG
ncbi:uncharacterized protein LOC123321024 [Coccinella septempunctata]|uniref:uncharacterized protein LOC123321024 n=1 Tax=Coccinella septempunctata TaxID=41139 RepID=UPI001D094FD4|nr:uncharacterized protein LOC123321024 [Coccinella septempunctata]